MKLFIAFMATMLTTITLAGFYFDRKDVAAIKATYGYTEVSLKWSEPGKGYTKHYVHYMNGGVKCANVIYMTAQGPKAQPWEVCNL